MKRMTVALLFCAFAVIGFSGCGGDDAATKKTTTETKKTDVKTETKPAEEKKH
jgi:hypothetical protein